MMDGPGTTPSSAFRRKLFRPCAAAAIESETTFDDLPGQSAVDPAAHRADGPDTLDDLDDSLSTPPPAVVGGVAVVGMIALVGVGGVMFLAALVAAASPAAGGTAHLLGLP